MAPENDRSLGVTVGPQSSGWNPARPLCVCHLCLLSNYTGSKDAGVAPHSLKYFPPAFPEVSSSCARPVEAFAPARFATPILLGLTEVLHLWTPLSPARCCSGGRGGARWGQEAQGHHEKVDCATTSLRFPREPSPSSALGPVGRARARKQKFEAKRLVISLNPKINPEKGSFSNHGCQPCPFRRLFLALSDTLGRCHNLSGRFVASKSRTVGNKMSYSQPC